LNSTFRRKSHYTFNQITELETPEDATMERRHSNNMDGKLNGISVRFIILILQCVKNLKGKDPNNTNFKKVKSTYRNLFRTKKPRHKYGNVKEGPHKKLNPKKPSQLQMNKVKTIEPKSTNNLIPDMLNTSSKQKTKNTLSGPLGLIPSSDAKTGNLNNEDLHDLKHLTLKSPLETTTNLNLSPIQRRERKPSFIKKLPIGLHNSILKDSPIKPTGKSLLKFLPKHNIHPNTKEESKVAHPSQSNQEENESDSNTEVDPDPTSPIIKLQEMLT
jgi:hypothetical protein